MSTTFVRIHHSYKMLSYLESLHAESPAFVGKRKQAFYIQRFTGFIRRMARSHHTTRLQLLDYSHHPIGSNSTNQFCRVVSSLVVWWSHDVWWSDHQTTQLSSFWWNFRPVWASCTVLNISELVVCSWVASCDVITSRLGPILETASCDVVFSGQPIAEYNHGNKRDVSLH